MHRVRATQSLAGDGALVGHVDTVKELSDILVSYTADTLDGSGCGWNLV